MTAAASVRLFHCMMPSANPVERPDDPVPALRREMRLLLVEQELMRAELAQRRAEAEQLSVMQDETRKAMEFWRREAESMAQERRRYSQSGWDFLIRLKSRLIAPAHIVETKGTWARIGRRLPQDRRR
jgi:hypothetical protein